MVGGKTKIRHTVLVTHAGMMHVGEGIVVDGDANAQRDKQTFTFNNGATYMCLRSKGQHKFGGRHNLDLIMDI